MHCIYVIRNEVNGKVYVGQTRNPAGRKSGHWCAGRNGYDHPLYRSMHKHGLENFTFTIIEECTEVTVDDREQFWISRLDCFNSSKGYNLTAGGERGKIFSEESKEKIRQKAFGRVHSIETKAKIGASHKGKQNASLSERNASSTGSKNHFFGKTGEAHPRAKLTQALANEIRSRSSEDRKTLALEFGVSRFTINRIIRNEIYKPLVTNKSSGQSTRFHAWGRM